MENSEAVKFHDSLSLTHDVSAGIKIQDVAETSFVLVDEALCYMKLFVFYGSLPHTAVDQQQS